YLHVFTYSERENTEAAAMEGIVPVAERKRRNKMLRILSEKKKLAFYESQLGNSFPVLWEHDVKGGMMFGFTENYIRVKKPFDESSENQIDAVKLFRTEQDRTVTVIPTFENFLVSV